MDIYINSQIATDSMDLFGVTPNTTLKELKQRYYEFALMCHPDNGGTTEDMHVVQDSYMRAKSQLELNNSSRDRMGALTDALQQQTLRCRTDKASADETDVDEADETKEHPCDDTTMGASPTELPSMRDIFDHVHDTFHADCQKECREHQQHLSLDTANELLGGNSHQQQDGEYDECGHRYGIDPYATQGYGSYMLERWRVSVKDIPVDSMYSPVYKPDVEMDTPLPEIQEATAAATTTPPTSFIAQTTTDTAPRDSTRHAIAITHASPAPKPAAAAPPPTANAHPPTAHQTAHQLSLYRPLTRPVGYPICVDPQQHIRDFTVSTDVFTNGVTPPCTTSQSAPCTDYRQAFLSHQPAPFSDTDQLK